MEALGGVSATADTDSEFTALYDSGDWDVLVIDVPGSELPSGVQARIYDRLDMGLPLIFSWWDLDSDASMAAALGVSTSSFSTPRTIHSSGASDLFDLVSVLPDPISSYTSDAGDNGDVVNPLDSSAIVHAVFDGDMPRECGVVDEDGPVADNGVVSDVAVGHEVVVVGDAGGLFGLAAVDRDPFAEHVAVADDDAGSLLVGIEVEILRWSADHRARPDAHILAKHDVAHHERGLGNPGQLGHHRRLAAECLDGKIISLGFSPVAFSHRLSKSSSHKQPSSIHHILASMKV